MLRILRFSIFDVSVFLSFKVLKMLKIAFNIFSTFVISNALIIILFFFLASFVLQGHVLFLEIPSYFLIFRNSFLFFSLSFYKTTFTIYCPTHLCKKGTKNITSYFHSFLFIFLSVFEKAP